MRHEYRTKGTCATRISFDLEDGVVRNVSFQDGCDGNLQAISRLVDGLTVTEIEEKLGGIRCGFRDTSCGDQLCWGIRMARENAK